MLVPFINDQVLPKVYLLIRGRPNRGVKTAIPGYGDLDNLAETAAILNGGGKRIESYKINPQVKF